jgi:hypothetical protein
MESSAMMKTLANIKKPESKSFEFGFINLFRRMQNRESAVRSRLRKKYHQDELEVKIIEMEQI